MNEEQDLLDAAALTVFRLNGQFLTIGDGLSSPVGISVAWWQVMAAIQEQPQPVAGIARAMGITRQSVQRIADLLVAKGLCEYRPNPAHKRAKLLAMTAEGDAAIHRINPQHAAMARRLADTLGPTEFAATVATLTRLSAALESIIAEDSTP
ncbi:MarR family winged helix-turn-helix transcriptional regulator [Nocardia mangyaensis]|uniref:MarR family winged helix-turn-helix transcriptional regulator n=1 Tax=Nocardia mangyaensis TaxID=2213200 RepID=UPI0019A20DA4|nr:MarR family transcriptional regulator [Nocardia mangyaensis]MBC7304791.1 MarR family transcriptional regulator [Nocardia sp.]MDO3648941.1 MarR family transcriptional regulator [Nocardia mangyaensis]